MTSGLLSLEFRRLLNTGDTSSDRLVRVVTTVMTLQITATGSMNLIWAAHATVPPTSNDTFAKHTHRGSTPVDLSVVSICPGGSNDIQVDMTLNTSLGNFDQSAFLASVASQIGVAAPRLVVTSVVEQSPPFCPECEKLDFTFPNYAGIFDFLYYSHVTVPSAETSYICVGFYFPTDREVTTIRFEPIVDNTQVVHHMIFFTTTSGTYKHILLIPI